MPNEKSVSQAQRLTIQRFINDPATRVCINHNDEAGIWQYSVQVVGDGYWLDSFDTEDKAKKFIEQHGLVEAV